MRDGELMPGIAMNLQQKIDLAKVLEAMGVDVIEVSYPGLSEKDFNEISTISKIIHNSTICGLAGSKESEIIKLAEAIKPAARSRMHLYTNLRLKKYDRANIEAKLSIIKDSISLAKNYCQDIEWSAFDAVRSDFTFLCQAIEIAIENGATTINIPDSLGTAKPEYFRQLINNIFERVPNIDRAILSVHCHEDLELAVENSLVAIDRGVRQIECSINGLGARKGNADLIKIVSKLLETGNYQINIDPALIDRAVELVNQITVSKY